MSEKIEKSIADAGFQVQRLDTASVRDGATWECKIGLKPGTVTTLPAGCDLPMRKAVEDAFRQMTGLDCDFNFSEWSAKLDEF